MTVWFASFRLFGLHCNGFELTRERTIRKTCASLSQKEMEREREGGRQRERIAEINSLFDEVVQNKSSKMNISPLNVTEMQPVQSSRGFAQSPFGRLSSKIYLQFRQLPPKTWYFHCWLEMQIDLCCLSVCANWMANTANATGMAHVLLKIANIIDELIKRHSTAACLNKWRLFCLCALVCVCGWKWTNLFDVI